MRATKITKKEFNLVFKHFLLSTPQDETRISIKNILKTIVDKINLASLSVSFIEKVSESEELQ